MTTNFMETDWKLFRSRIDMITLDTADDAINIADTLYNTMVHTDSNIIPEGCGQTLGDANHPWDSLFTSVINTGSNPLSIENDLDVIGNADIGNYLNVVGNALFLSNMIIDHNLTVNDGNINMENGNFTLLNGNINMHNGILTVNSGIIVNNGGVNILHGGMNIVDGVNMQNTLTVNNGISLTNGTFNISLCPINAHAGLNVQNGITTDTLNITGQTTGGLYPIQIINSSSSTYTISTTITSFSDNLFLINNNTVGAGNDYHIVLPLLTTQYGAHLTIGTIVQLADANYYINSQGGQKIYGIVAGGNGTTGATVYTTSGFKVINPYHGDSHELIFTQGGWLLRGFVSNGENVSSL